MVYFVMPSKSSSLVWRLRRGPSAFFCHLSRMLTCLNPVIVLWNARPDLVNVGDVRNEAAIVRDSKVVIKIPKPDQAQSAQSGL